MTRRTWVKMWVTDCIEGSIRWQLDPDERSVWYDLILFSALCDPPGIIADKSSRPYPHDFIANRLNVPLALLEDTLKKCAEDGRIREDENGIHIVNWQRYQSDYQRQKPYRQKATVKPPEAKTPSRPKGKKASPQGEEYTYFDESGRPHSELRPKVETSPEDKPF